MKGAQLVLNRVVRHPERPGQSVQAFVQRPQFDAGRHQRGRQENHVNKSAAETIEPFAVYEVHHLSHARLLGLLQPFNVSQRLRSRWRRTTREFTQDHGVHQHHVQLEQVAQGGVVLTKVVNPHRCVNENAGHRDVSPRRRGMSPISGMLAPSAASRLAA